ncbi:ribbon-helix-helix domain-containing protein [uncultured Nitrosomonas sp.]|uniref:ribbon-helix-helix domain-containing protein n=1 Tax=uncultured Nitrosomonas sp. TaxID=156424 RepID=UPI0025FA1035|nr:ribbon-helix-helix domain-containing protein [uncultured Nitrosomonas sp.]
MSNKFVNALKKKPEEHITKFHMEDKAGSIHDRPSRKNTKHIGGYFSEEVSKQLRQIALDEDSSVQQLLGEALDMIFHSRKKPTIAQKITN